MAGQDGGQGLAADQWSVGEELKGEGEELTGKWVELKGEGEDWRIYNAIIGPVSSHSLDSDSLSLTEMEQEMMQEFN